MRMLSLLLFLSARLAGHLQADPPITAAALTPDGKQIVIGSQNGIDIRSWPELVAVGSLATELIHVHDLRFSPDGQTLLAAGGAPAEAGITEMWSWPVGNRIRSIAGHDDVIYRAAWSPDGQQWATASADGFCQTFDANTGERLVRYEGHSRAVLALCYMPDGKTIASVGVDQTLRLWDSHSGVHRRTLDNHVGTINGVSVQPVVSKQSPPVVATIAEDRTVRFWQPSIGRLVRFARLPSVPRSLVWSTDGSRLLVGCNDGRIRIIDAEDAETVGDIDGIDGRIYELVIDLAKGRLFIGGEADCRSVAIGETNLNIPR
jgi:WD40 repeat protein